MVDLNNRLFWYCVISWSPVLIVYTCVNSGPQTYVYMCYTTHVGLGSKHCAIHTSVSTHIYLFILVSGGWTIFWLNLTHKEKKIFFYLHVILSCNINLKVQRLLNKNP